MKKTKSRPKTKRVTIDAEALLGMHNAVECFLDDCNELMSYAAARGLLATGLEERIRPIFYSEAWQTAAESANRLKTQGNGTK